jgi:polysaccharide pyruvyl transferase CsaB
MSDTNDIQGTTDAAKTPRVLVLGNYGCSNAGDELLLATIKLWVEAAGGDLRAISLNPAYTTRLHGVPAVDYFDLSAIAQEMNRADLFVLGGGGMFQDRWPMTADALYRYPSYSLLQFAQVCYLPRQFGVPSLIWAQGVGPLESEEARGLVADLYSAVDDLCIRDEVSASLLRACGVVREIAVAPDPVWALPLVSAPLDLEARFPELTGKRVLVVNALSFPFERAWEGVFMAALEETLPPNWICLWMPFQHNAYAAHPSGYAMPDDASHFRAMLRQAGDPARHIIWERPDVFEIQSAFAGADAVIAMRFHGAILASRSGTPFITIEYDDKVRQAMDQLQLSARNRVSLLASENDYVQGMTWLFSQASRGEKPETGTTVEALADRALLHRDVLKRSLAKSLASAARPPWRSGRFDWLSAWITQMEKDRWQAVHDANAARVQESCLQAELQSQVLRVRELEEVLRQQQRDFIEQRSRPPTAIGRLLRRLLP